eukprot:gene14092-14211_t
MVSWHFGAVFMVLPLMAGAALAAEAPVQLTVPHDLAKDLAAFPQVSGRDAIADKINAALTKLDKKVLKARAECVTTKNADWSRNIDVTMRGPRFLSYQINDSLSCSGSAHPDTASFALVYDLTTGSPVDWARLLPKSLVETTSLDSAADGTKIGVVGSKLLSKIYIEGLGKDIDADCKEALSSADLTFILWLDAKKKGVSVQTVSLPHVVAAS